MNVKIKYEMRDISVPKKVAEFLEADKRRIEAQRRSDRRHLSKGELEPMLDRYVTDSYNTEKAALRNLTLENLRSAIATLDTLFCLLDNLYLWCKNKSLNERALKYQLNNCISDAKKYVDLILKQHGDWESELGVDADMYNNIDIDVIKKYEYQYTQTIPISEAALEVDFNEFISINDDNTFSISGKTNLFNDAVLMLSIRDDKGKLCSQGKATVLNGLFQFPKMSNKGKGYNTGTYKGDISLSLPSVQPKTFREKAGIEYENLTGKYINRIGIGPTVEYEFSFQIK